MFASEPVKKIKTTFELHHAESRLKFREAEALMAKIVLGSKGRGLISSQRVRRLSAACFLALLAPLFLTLNAVVAQGVDCQAILNRLVTGGVGDLGPAEAQRLGQIYNQYCQGGGGGAPQSRCPGGTQECGNVCCNAGNSCTRMGGDFTCIPIGAQNCGNYYCQPGSVCSPNGKCMPAGATACSSGKYCKEGFECWTAPEAVNGIAAGETTCLTLEGIAKAENALSLRKEGERKQAAEKKEAEFEKAKSVDAAGRTKSQEQLKSETAKKDSEALSKSAAQKDQALKSDMAGKGTAPIASPDGANRVPLNSNLKTDQVKLQGSNAPGEQEKSRHQHRPINGRVLALTTHSPAGHRLTNTVARKNQDEHLIQLHRNTSMSKTRNGKT